MYPQHDAEKSSKGLALRQIEQPLIVVRSGKDEEMFSWLYRFCSSGARELTQKVFTMQTAFTPVALLHYTNCVIIVELQSVEFWFVLQRSECRNRVRGRAWRY